MESFEHWLNQQLNERGWSQSEAARRSSVSASMFSQVISGVAKPGPDFLIGVARAFRLSRREVFERAGMIETSPPVDTPSILEMTEAFAYLEPNEQEFFLRMLKTYVADRRGTYQASSADNLLRPGPASDSA